MTTSAVPTVASRAADPRTSIEAAWQETEKKRDAIKYQRRRLEWTLFGSTRDLQKYLQQQPIQLDNLIRALTLALTVAKELRDVAESDKELNDGF